MNERKKCIGESGDIGDIAKIVNIAMQKKCILPASDAGEKKKEKSSQMS